MEAPSTEAARLILSARRSAGLTQTELARRAGVTHSVLSAYEHGRRDPGATALARILSAAGFRVTLARRSVDLERAGRLLSEALDLADSLPKRRRPAKLSFPGLP